MHRLFHWTRGHIEVLRAWQRHAASCFADWPQLTAIYTRLKAFPTVQQTKWRRRCKATLWGVALCLAVNGYQPAQADTITVDGSCTLADAITAANTDTTTGNCVHSVTSGADTLVLTVDTTLTSATAISDPDYGPTGLPIIESEITIEGDGHTIERDPMDSVFFRLLTIGATGDLTVQDTTLSGGIASTGRDGGGLANYSGQLRLERCVLSGNTAGDSGGGVYSYTNGSDEVSIIDSTFESNSATSGGGALSGAFGGSTTSVVASTLSGNMATFAGGGILGFASDTSILSILNSTLSDNLASYDDGGGMHLRSYDSSATSLVHSTLSGNMASTGGGVYSYTSGSGTVELHRNLLAGNAASRGDEVYHADFGGSFLVDDANLFGHDGASASEALYGVVPGITDILATSDRLDVPLSGILAALADNGGSTLTHNLVTGSPALDAAGACGLAADQRGVVRPQGAACDIGAVESQAPADPCTGAVPTMGCKVNGMANQLCMGTDLGTGKDVIVGTSGDDIVFGGVGNDELKGGAGHDLLCGGSGNDLLFGGGGNDTLIGGADNDELRGEAGMDALDGGSGNDLLLGGLGDDALIGGDDTDVLKGNAGVDTCDGETEVTCEL